MRCTSGCEFREGGTDWEVELQNVIQEWTGHVPVYERSSSLTEHVRRIARLAAYM